MKKILLSFLRQILFWLLFFDFTRLVFILFHSKLLVAEKVTLTEIPGMFWYSINLDLATACYIMVFPFLLLLVQSIYSPNWINTINKVYTGFIIFCYSLTAVGEMGIYAEWKTKLTYKVIKYLSHPSEIYNSAETSTFFILLVLFFFLFLTGIFLYIRFFHLQIAGEKRNWWFSFLFLLIIPGLIIIGMRGGVQQIPINQSQSYYSKHNILNLASVNNGFNLYISIFENLSNFNRDPYIFMDHKAAENLVKKIYETQKDTTIHILNIPKPNIVLLIMESWSADLIEDLGGEPGITPEFRNLEKNGILFDQVYASGARSEQGMAAIFGGFPATPVSSITVQPDKFVKLPSLTQILDNNGYHTSFYFGGQLIYGNIKSYIIFNNFDKIMEGADFPASIPRGKLGIHDQYMLDWQIGDLNKEKEPFFSALFTVSTHSPWDQPYPKPLKWGDNEHEYINAAYYTDHCLGEYFRKASKQPWFDRTLFIIVADHSHNSYRNWHLYSKNYHKIPFLFYGNAIKPEFRGTRVSKLGNQNDLAVTLLTQLGYLSNRFTWSKNLLNPFSPDFAYFSTDDGGGWIRPEGWFSFDAGPKIYHFIEINENRKDSVMKEGKAYLQTLFREYMNH
ncbi:MAG: sulfatase-like hydrolase/transferase [Bacteroidota bacterium]